MKTKCTNKLLVLIISVMMIATLFVGMSVTASAAEAEGTGAEFVGFQVNLGGDISMKYYVKNHESTVEQEMIWMKVTYLGTITEINDSTYIEDQDVYVFTFDGINPQCLGDEIDAELYIIDIKVDEKLDYSVEDNLNGIYNDSDAKTKQLIDDLRAYGKASEAYTGHISMTGNYTIREIDVPAASIGYSDSSAEVDLQSVNVRFGSMNYLMFKFSFADGTTPAELNVTIDGEAPADAYMDGNTFVVVSKPISPENFYKDVNVIYNNGDINASFSINDYCAEILKDTKGDEGNYNAKMENLAQALYNYGLSAHLYLGGHTGGEATCLHGKLCEICGTGYDTTLDSNNHVGGVYTYEDNDDGTHKKICECGITIDEAESHTFDQSGLCVCDAQAVAKVGNMETSYTYTGEAIKPEITITVGGKTLIEGTDYTVFYKNNVYVGSATVTITFKGNYTGTATATFEITCDHSYSEDKYTNNGDGTHCFTCTVCGGTETEEHTFADDDGICTVCQYVVEIKACGVELATEGKLVYFTGEELDFSGFSFNLLFSNGDSKPLALDDVTIDDSDIDTEESGTYTVAVSYKNFDPITFDVIVYAVERLELSFYTIERLEDDAEGNPVYHKNSFKTIYSVGEELDTNGLSVYAVVTRDGETQRIEVSDYEITGFDSSATTQCTLIISALGAEVMTTVHITDVAPTPDESGVYQLLIDPAYLGLVAELSGPYHVFNTIQQALDYCEQIDADAMKTISVAPGIYNEKLEITIPNLSIVGVGETPADTIITFDDVADQSEVNGFVHVLDTTATVTVRESAYNVKIVNLTISNPNDIDESDGALTLLVQSEGFVFEGA